MDGHGTDRNLRLTLFQRHNLAFFASKQTAAQRDPGADCDLAACGATLSALGAELVWTSRATMTTWTASLPRWLTAVTTLHMARFFAAPTLAGVRAR